MGTIIKGCTGYTQLRSAGLADGFFGGGGFGPADNGGIAADEAEGVLVEDGGHGFIQFGQLMPELNGALEEYFNGHGPEFVVIGGGIIPQQIFSGAFDLLHGREDRAGYF